LHPPPCWPRLRPPCSLVCAVTVSTFTLVISRVCGTCASNSLYSASLFERYVSISFLASSRASLTRLVRSVMSIVCAGYRGYPNVHSRAVSGLVSTLRGQVVGLKRTLLDNLGRLPLGLVIIRQQPSPNGPPPLSSGIAIEKGAVHRGGSGYPQSFVPTVTSISIAQPYVIRPFPSGSS